jgi:hypothetical protein
VVRDHRRRRVVCHKAQEERPLSRGPRGGGRGRRHPADRRLKLGHRRPHGGAADNPLFDVELREVVVARPDKNEPLYLLTNDLTRPAAQIAEL